MIIKVKKTLALIRAFFPSRLPVGVSEFKEWSDSIQSLYKLPTDDADSIRFVLASMLLRLNPTEAYKSKYFFFLSLHTAGVKQVAGAMFQEIKESQAAKAASAVHEVPRNISV